MSRDSIPLMNLSVDCMLTLMYDGYAFQFWATHVPVAHAFIFLELYRRLNEALLSLNCFLRLGGYRSSVEGMRA